MSNEGLEAVAACIRQGFVPCLRKLDLSNIYDSYSIASHPGVLALARALQAGCLPKLEILILTGNDITSNGELRQLSFLRPQFLLFIESIRHCAGTYALAEALIGLPRLQVLDISDNYYLGDSGIQHMVEMARRHCADLIEWHIGCCKISGGGYEVVDLARGLVHLPKLKRGSIGPFYVKYDYHNRLHEVLAVLAGASGRLDWMTEIAALLMGELAYDVALLRIPDLPLAVNDDDGTLEWLAERWLGTAVDSGLARSLSLRSHAQPAAQSIRAGVCWTNLEELPVPPSGADSESKSESGPRQIYYEVVEAWLAEFAWLRRTPVVAFYSVSLGVVSA
jgi:hypothetical protein